jgi:biopolymer transport protein ExbD
MRTAALLVIAASLAAGDGPKVRVPTASEAQAPLEGAAILSLTADGLVLVRKDGKEESVSIEKLLSWLPDRIAGSGKRPKSAKEGATAVVIRADEKAPWLHVQRLLEACREAGVERTAFLVRGARGEEGRLGPAEGPPRAFDEATGVRLAVRIAVTREEIAVWGPTQIPVKVPSEILFRMGGVEAREIEAVRRYLRDAGQTAGEAGASIQATIEPDAKVPWGVVAGVLNEYHRAGLRDAAFKFVEEKATDEERRAGRLPYPSSR